MSEETYSQIFTLTDLISAPLIATVQGDFYAAERFVTYLRQYGFEPPAGGAPWDFGKLRMVVFQYRTPDGWMEMHVPLISLIPLPLLSVADAEFRYNLKILGLLGSLGPTRDPAVHMALPLGEPIAPHKIMGSFAPLRPQAEVADETPTLVANMDIKIRMRQSDLPAGIAAMLNVVQSSVGGSMRNRIRIIPAVTALSEEYPDAESRIALIDGDGKPLQNYLVNIVAAPKANTAHLLPPVVVEGTLVSISGEFVLSVLTNAEGMAVLRWKRGSAPQRQADVMVSASAEVDFPGGQFGPIQATALLQILPSDPTLPRSA